MLIAILIKLFLPYLLPFLFIVFVALSESYRLMNPVKYSKEWHMYKGLYQATFFTLVACYDFWFSCVCASLFWIIHDIIVNIYGLNRTWDYIGNTAKLDRIFRTFWAQFSVKIITLIIFICGWIGVYDRLF